ncbi:MAG: FAD synthetase family protein [Thermoflexales bacterium]|nr:FAD synthetase family protein [Thermoflexales bacterium]MCS7324131.1 FAD synthetase family protein [Thermoflexales bacterium]MCX7939411.1 FAD synthetase family protein [Thermoflexales bacterium]MDW8053646.1 FAD synthetase family protein [Anaerolineae bacterium]MDW8292501.1 FAD synthetase family protein [Anaerolineae bacterium]
MQHLDSLEAFNDPKLCVCTIGAFDGVHLGHQQIIRHVVQQARAHEALALVLTFFPHPRAVLGRAPDRYLTLPEEKAEHIAALGVDVLITHPFTLETARITAEQFLGQLLHHLRLVSLWVGPDFALGHNREGNVSWLRARGAQLGFEVNVLPPLVLGHARISSTRIRDALLRGDIRDANLCLGRPFRIHGDYDGEHRVCTHPKQWLPGPGTYTALIEERTLEVTLTSDAPCTLYLEHPIAGGARRLTVTFV